MNQDFPKHFIVGLTGGIGSGKTTVSNLFSKFGIDIIDADVISRNLLSKKSPYLQKVIQHFGNDFLTSSGELKRSLLAKIIFSHEDEKKWLESLLHPAIQEKIHSLIGQSRSQYLILSAPLLLENSHYGFIDRVLVIDISLELQLSRTADRDNKTKTDIKKIMLAQMEREERLSYADDIILNNSDLTQLNTQVKKLHEQYTKQSQLKH